jgi:hypothetical protein
MSSFELDRFPRQSSSSQLKYGLAIDIVLVLLGGSTVWLATQHLSLIDLRPLYNAWTYIVGIPLGLILVDVIFRTVVSRFIERTLQVAFLLSVLVHLLMTLGAIRTVLFADGSTDQIKKAVSLASKPEKVSSVPEYVLKFDDSKTDRPDYLRPAQTESAQATQIDPDKEDVEIPSNLPALAKIPDTASETPEPKISKVKEEWNEPDIRSSVAKLDRPRLAQPIEELPSSIEVPKNQPMQGSEYQEPSEAQPKALSSKKQTSESSLIKPSLDRVEPSLTSEINRVPSPSKSPQRLERRDFELPSIEDRKTELARRDLSSENASRLSTPSINPPRLGTSRPASGFDRILNQSVVRFHAPLSTEFPRQAFLPASLQLKPCVPPQQRWPSKLQPRKRLRSTVDKWLLQRSKALAVISVTLVRSRRKPFRFLKGQGGQLSRKVM